MDENADFQSCVDEKFVQTCNCVGRDTLVKKSLVWYQSRRSQACWLKKLFVHLEFCKREHRTLLKKIPGTSVPQRMNSLRCVEYPATATVYFTNIMHDINRRELERITVRWISVQRFLKQKSSRIPVIHVCKNEKIQPRNISSGFAACTCPRYSKLLSFPYLVIYPIGYPRDAFLFSFILLLLFFFVSSSFLSLRWFG